MTDFNPGLIALCVSYLMYDISFEIVSKIKLSYTCSDNRCFVIEYKK